MTSNTYDRISQLCVGVALISAIAFDYATGFKWPVISIGIAAALVATVLHFYHLREPASEAASEDSKSPNLQLAKIEWRYPAATSERAVLARMLNPEECGQFYTSAVDRFWQVRTTHTLTYNLFFSKSQQEEFSNRIAHALTPLYDTGPARKIELECVVTRAGNFVFIVRNATKSKHPLNFVDIHAAAAAGSSSGEWKVDRQSATFGGLGIDVSRDAVAF